MYKEINELVDELIEDPIYINYKEKEKNLYDPTIMALLSQQQMLQEDYLRLRDYESYISIEETKNALKDIKKEISENKTIQAYYQSYYELNDLLDEITSIVFNGISHDIVLKRWK